MTKKTIVRRVALCLVLATMLLLPVLGLLHARAAAQPAPVQLGGTTVSDHSFPTGKHLMEWGVAGYAVGEFAGLIGMGVCSIRRQKRRGRERVVMPEYKKDPLLYYDDYKAAARLAG